MGDFLYNGEVFIAQEVLGKFLETAQELQVKGLQIYTQLSGDKLSENNAGAAPLIMPNKNPAIEDVVPIDTNVKDVGTEKQSLIKNEHGLVKNEGISRRTFEEEICRQRAIRTKNIVGEQEVIEVEVLTCDTNDVKTQKLSKPKQEGIMSTLDELEELAANIDNKNVHIENQEPDLQVVQVKGNNKTDMSHVCQICNKSSQSKISLQMHNLNNHSGARHTCGICGKSGMSKIDHRNHKRSNH